MNIKNEFENDVVEALKKAGLTNDNCLIQQASIELDIDELPIITVKQKLTPEEE